MRWFKKEVAYREASFKESTGNESVHMLGQGAKSILENEAFDAAFKKIEADLTGLWKASNPNQSEAREYVYYELQALARVKGKLLGMLNGMLIEQKIEKQRQANGSAQGE